MRFKRSLFIPAVALFVAVAAVAQTSNCPNNSPTNRPATATTSNFDLKKLLTQMVAPQGNLIEVIAHRGNWQYCPENTLEAFQAAWDINAEASEADVRLAAVDTNYPAGEAILSHDFDLRGQAPNTVGQSTNYIYSLTPAEIAARYMVDRHGNMAKDSNGNTLHMPTFTDLLNSFVGRAKQLPNAIVSQGSQVIGSNGTHWDLMTRGLLLIIDIKGGKSPTPSGQLVDQYNTFLECVRELNAFQSANHIDLRYGIAFKVSYNAIYPTTSNSQLPTAAQLVTRLMASDMNYVQGDALPKLIFIAFPEDACVPGTAPIFNSTLPLNLDPCQLVLPHETPGLGAGLTDLMTNYVLPGGSNSPANADSAPLVVDWQYRNPNDALASYLTTWNTRGVAMFLGNNAFSDGLRNSEGNCQNYFPDPEDLGGDDLPRPINTSQCTTDPVQRWNSSSLDYLVPDPGFLGNPNIVLTRANAITADQYQNVIDYLTAINQNDQSLIE